MQIVITVTTDSNGKTYKTGTITGTSDRESVEDIIKATSQVEEYIKKTK